jgi:glycosyltransferase involved in cell wall biosynthesis
MRVLLTCEDYFPHIGGAEVCVHHLCKELGALGHQVTIFTNTIEVMPGEQDVVRLGWRFRPRQFVRHVSVLWGLIRGADVVHCTYSFRISALCAIIAFIQRKPMLLTQQGRGIVPEAGAKWYYSLLLKVCQHVSMKLATHITSTSDEITDLTAAFVPRSKITLVSNGYDAHVFRSDAKLPIPSEYINATGCSRILTVRRLVPKNGIHILIQALAIVRDRGIPFHYFAVGEGRMESFIRSIIAELNLGHCVTLLGKKSNDLLASYYQHTDLVIIPSSAEARSIACIEAMAMAKPIIASRVGGLIDLLERDGLFGELVSVYDSEACTYAPPERLPHERLLPLAEAIIRYIQDPSRLVLRASDAAAFVRAHYSWSTITLRYLALYEQILRRFR